MKSSSPVLAVSEGYAPIINTLQEGASWAIGVSFGMMALLAVSFVVGYLIRKF